MSRKGATAQRKDAKFSSFAPLRLCATVFATVLCAGVALTGCGLSKSEAPPLSPEVNLPAFVDEPEYGTNEDIAAPRQQRIFNRNFNAMEEILKYDPARVRQEMLKRLSADQPMSLRLIAASVLVLKNDDHGRQFFIAQSKIPQGLGNVYVTFNRLVWSAKPLTGSETDLAWAEDLMIEALQNRTQVSRQVALPFPEFMRSDERMMEIRELAIRYGEFADHVAKMRSEKGLPVILSLLREKLPYRVKTCILYLGRYKDEQVGPVVLGILSSYEDEHTYSFAVRAASDLGLKAAVPILLRHLSDEASYAGLRSLADASAIPAIKAALPRLKSYARAEAELTLIHLQGGDVVPPLLRLLKRKDFLLRTDVLIWLEKLHDPRSIEAVTPALCHDKKASVRSWAIRVLAAVKNKEAVQGLVTGLGCDYSNIERWKTHSDHDFNTEFREEIAKALHQITGENFGPGQKQWQLWLDQQTF